MAHHVSYQPPAPSAGQDAAAALSPAEALDLLRRAEVGRAERVARLHARGYPASATSAGWLGYDDDKLRRLCKQAMTDGFTQIKLKVGNDLDDLRRLHIAHEACGPHTPASPSMPTSAGTSAPRSDGSRS